MKLFQSSAAKTAERANSLNVQATPAKLLNGLTQATCQVKVDLCCRVGRLMVVAGWRTQHIPLALALDGQVLDVRETAFDRPDVDKHFALPAGSKCGFVLVADSDKKGDVALTWDAGDEYTHVSAPLEFRSEVTLSASDQSVLGPALGLLAGAQPLNSTLWQQLIKQAQPTTVACATAKGYLEGAAACQQTSDAVLVGWAVQRPGTLLWVEDQHGKAYSLAKAFRRFRQDVHDAVSNEFGNASQDAGFVLHVHGVKPGAVLKLKALSELGIHTLSETSCSTLPVDPVGAARWLFAVGTPMSEFHERIPLIDDPVLQPLIENRQTMWGDLPVLQRTLGKPVASPQASIIVPLYGRMDFVEHQLLEFAKDPWLLANVEIIYVLDDPKLVEPFGTTAETLHRLYRVPFTWVWGSVNRGFSGANNLGADHAHGEHLVFLNSDAFPQRPGWIQPMLDALAQNPQVGAVGPRLLFGDGGIQHAGMQFMRREELGIWVNHHPNMGLDPSLDPHTTLTTLPAITGACLVMRRKDFDDIGGWDTGYLVGDFEDSDLCLKLRSKGLQVAYLPSVQLTHLERQSFKLLGQDEFRTRVVIYNAVRHQSRWGELIASTSQPA